MARYDVSTGQTTSSLVHGLRWMWGEIETFPTMQGMAAAGTTYDLFRQRMGSLPGIEKVIAAFGWFENPWIDADGWPLRDGAASEEG